MVKDLELWPRNLNDLHSTRSQSPPDCLLKMWKLSQNAENVFLSDVRVGNCLLDLVCAVRNSWTFSEHHVATLDDLSSRMLLQT